MFCASCAFSRLFHWNVKQLDTPGVVGWLEQLNQVVL